jgi:hypothetical protein
MEGPGGHLSEVSQGHIDKCVISLTWGNLKDAFLKNEPIVERGIEVTREWGV